MPQSLQGLGIQPPQKRSVPHGTSPHRVSVRCVGQAKAVAPSPSVSKILGTQNRYPVRLGHSDDCIHLLCTHTLKITVKSPPSKLCKVFILLTPSYLAFLAACSEGSYLLAGEFRKLLLSVCLQGCVPTWTQPLLTSEGASGP